MIDKTPVMMSEFKIDKVEARKAPANPVPNQSRRQRQEEAIDVDSSVSEVNALDKRGGSSEKTQKMKSIQ